MSKNEVQSFVVKINTQYGHICEDCLFRQFNHHLKKHACLIKPEHGEVPEYERPSWCPFTTSDVIQVTFILD